MIQRFYVMANDMSHGRRWYLRGPVGSSGQEIDPRLFTYGVVVGPQGTLHVPLRLAGPSWDFTLADFDMPVVSAELGAHLKRLAPQAVQRFPVSVEGTQNSYEILNVTRTLRCFDEFASEIQYVTQDEFSPERIGSYEMVLKPVIDPAKVGNEQLFRVSGWEVMLVCSGDIRDELVAKGYSGLELQELDVSPMRPEQAG
jgi:hypothetical protein